MHIDLLISKQWLIHFRWYLSAISLFSYLVSVSLKIIDHSSVFFILLIIFLLSNIAVDKFTKDKMGESDLFRLILLDLSIITTGLLYTGGATNPFSILYLVYIVFSSLLLGQARTIFTTTISILLYGALLLIPDSGSHHNHHSSNYNTHLVGMWVAYSLVAFICSFSISYLSALLKKTLGEREALQNKEIRLRSLTTLAAGAAHELRTPLNTALLHIEELKEILKNQHKDLKSLESAREIEEQIKRCTTIINDLNANSGNLEPEKQTSISLNDFFDFIIKQININNNSRISINKVNLDEIIQIPIQSLSRSIKSLIQNSLESRSDINIEVSSEIDDEFIHFTIKDNGPGIDKNIISLIGEPFITNKAAGNGMGLGLFIAKLTANTYGGDLKIIKSNSDGTSIRLSIRK